MSLILCQSSPQTQKPFSFSPSSSFGLSVTANYPTSPISTPSRVVHYPVPPNASLAQPYTMTPVAEDIIPDMGLQGETVKGRCLVIADGATSRLATELGYCTEPPKGVCSRAFVEGGTHNANFDGSSCFCLNSNLQRRPIPPINAVQDRAAQSSHACCAVCFR